MRTLKTALLILAIIAVLLWDIWWIKFILRGY